MDKLINSIRLRLCRELISYPAGVVCSREWVYMHKSCVRQYSFMSTTPTKSPVVSYSVVSFYKFAKIEDPSSLVIKLTEKLRDLLVNGRIYVNGAGINAQMCLPSEHVSDALNLFRGHYIDQINYNIHKTNFQVFNKLRIRHGKLLEGMDDEFNPSESGTPLSPDSWNKILDENAEKTTILDVRNKYEWEVGHFKGSVNSNLRKFSQFPEYATKIARDLNKDDPVLMYCTGGIRCELFSAMLKHKGFTQIYQLEGGVLKYGSQPHKEHWRGRLFVFDDRLVVPVDGGSPRFADEMCDDVISKCCYCGQPTESCYNCANRQCNNIFMACDSCARRHTACCSVACAASADNSFQPRNRKQVSLHKTIGRGAHYRKILTKLYSD